MNKIKTTAAVLKGLFQNIKKEIKNAYTATKTAKAKSKLDAIQIFSGRCTQYIAQKNLLRQAKCLNMEDLIKDREFLLEKQMIDNLATLAYNASKDMEIQVDE